LLFSFVGLLLRIIIENTLPQPPGIAVAGVGNPALHRLVHLGKGQVAGLEGGPLAAESLQIGSMTRQRAWWTTRSRKGAALTRRRFGS
jgi:hypothetical protein